jgi:hypothetical protein
LLPSYRAFVSSLSSIFKDWMEIIKNTRWKEVMAKEIRALLKNEI